MEDMLKKVLERIPPFQADFADIHFVDAQSTHITVQDGRADKIHASNQYGAGIRVLSKGAWGFASVNEITPKTLEAALEDALSAAHAASQLTTDPGRVCEVGPFVDEVKTPVEIDPRDVPLEDKVDLASEWEKAARQRDPEHIANTIVNYTDMETSEVVVNTFGTCVKSESIRSHASCMVTAREGALRQSASERVGRVQGYELAKNLDPEAFSISAADKAVSLLNAQNAPAGKFPVVLDPQVTGLFTHEALGHNAEADAVWSGESILEGKKGQQVASELVSIYDDSTLPGTYGSYAYDSEGTPGQRRALIEKGISKGYMQSLETAAKLGEKPNGSARAMNHQCAPIVRMSNTFIEAGDWSLDEMLSDVKDGVLLSGGQWGHVFVERGQFTCNAERGWRIRDGELCEMLRNVSAAGMTLETLNTIDAVGDKVEMESPGMCGKNGQWMPVDNGGPYVRVKELVVGGQQ